MMPKEYRGQLYSAVSVSEAYHCSGWHAGTWLADPGWGAHPAWWAGSLAVEPNKWIEVHLAVCQP